MERRGDLKTLYDIPVFNIFSSPKEQPHMGNYARNALDMTRRETWVLLKMVCFYLLFEERNELYGLQVDVARAMSRIAFLTFPGVSYSTLLKSEASQRIV